jgi:hypothetical protein
MTITIIFYGAQPLLEQGETSIPVNTSGSFDEAIETTRHELLGNKSWAERVEILDKDRNLQLSGTKEDFLSGNVP